RHRYGEVHLLRALPGGVPRGCNRRRAEFRIRHRNARGTVLRQGTPAGERRSLGTRDRQEYRARRAVQVTAMKMISHFHRRHGRVCPGHPRLSVRKAVKTWMPGTGPGMTTESAEIVR